MKNLLFIFLLFCGFTSVAQKTQIVQGAASSTTVALVASTTTALQSATRSGRTTAIVLDTLAGGHFSHSSATLTDNGGTIFAALGGGHWLRDMSQSQGLNAKWFGAKGDGSTNDTRALQAFANTPASSHYIPDGTYMVDSTGMNLRSNTNLVLSQNAVIKMIGTSQVFYGVLGVDNVSNVTISGGSIIGDRTTHIGTTSEYGMCISITNSSNINISDINLSNGWGDGIYIGGTTQCTYIKISNVTAFNNRRNNMSITNAAHVTVSNSSFNTANGTAPQSGIDIEPNAGYTISDITFTNVTTTGNTSQGFIVSGIASTFINNININNLISYSNGGNGLTIGTSSTTPIDAVTVNGVRSTSNSNHQVVLGGINNLKISNVTTSSTVTNGNGIYFTGKITNSKLDNFIITSSGTNGVGINISGADSSLSITHGEIQVPGNAIYTPTSVAITDITIDHVKAKNSLVEGFKIWNATNSNFTNNYILNCGKIGMQFVNGKNSSVLGNTVYGAGQNSGSYYAISFEGTAESYNVQHNVARFGDSTNGITYGIVTAGATVNNLIKNNDLLSSGSIRTAFNAGTNNILDTARGLVDPSSFLPLTAGMAKVISDTLYTGKGIFVPFTSNGTTATPSWNTIATYGSLAGIRSQIEGGNSFSSNSGTLLRFRVSNASGVLTTSGRMTANGDFDSLNTIKATSFVKYGGLPTDFLMGDGSSNSNSYASLLSPSFTTPTLGVATATSINKVAITAPATSAMLTIANGKTLTANNSLTLAGTDATTMTFPTTSATIARTDAGNTFTSVNNFDNIQMVTTGSIKSSGNSVLNFGHRADIGIGIAIAPVSATTITSGTKTAVSITETFSPTSGTGISNLLLLNPTHNQTGGANGITRGLWIVPVLTAAADWRSIQIDNATGYAIYAGAAAKNYLNGITGIGAVPVTDKLEVTGNVALMAAGNKIKIATGSNASVGTATLVAGTVTISNTSVTASSQIWVEYNGAPATVTSVLTVPTITASTSFVITAITPGTVSTATTDVNSVKYWIIN